MPRVIAAPTDVIPAPTDVIPAPIDVIAAPTDVIPAPLDAIPAPIHLIPAKAGIHRALAASPSMDSRLRGNDVPSGGRRAHRRAAAPGAIAC